MITYTYWALIIGLAVAVIVVGVKLSRTNLGILIAAILLLIGWTAYEFYFQQIFVKRWGGVMTISVPRGQMHIATTWKDDNLWVENYDPEEDKCVFSEYSKGNLLQGRVTIKNCNPIARFGADRPRPDAEGAPSLQE